jgi:hypothetical protein
VVPRRELGFGSVGAWQLHPDDLNMFSFSNNKKRATLEKYVRRLADITTPSIQLIAEDLREHRRQNRVIPTILVPWEDDSPVVGEATVVLLKDISDHGVGLVLNHPFRAGRILIGVWIDEEERPWFFLGEVKQNSPIGGGYWVIGVKLTEVFEGSDPPGTAELAPLVEKLLPSSRHAYGSSRR